MVIVNTAIEVMLKEINFKKIVRFDYLIPSEFSECSPVSKWIPPYKFDTPPGHNDIPEFSDLWIQFMMDKYGNDLQDIVSLINKKRGVSGYDRGRTGGRIIAVALENAFYHGNKNNPDLSVSVKVFEGERGIVVRIRDSGVGFDYLQVTDKFEKLRKKDIFLPYSHEKIQEEDRYFLRRGGGFQMFCVQDEKVSFEHSGTAINIMYKS